MTGSGPTVQQLSYALSCELLRRVLRPVLAAGHAAADATGTDAGGVLGVEQRACAGLFTLLLDHSVDRRGRCHSCRRPGAIFGRRRRRCEVHRTVGHWLQQPHIGILLRRLADELDTPTPPSAINPDAPPRIAADPTGPGSAPHQSPAIPPSPPSPLGDAPRRDGRIRITAGPGRYPAVPGPAVIHPTYHPPERGSRGRHFPHPPNCRKRSHQECDKLSILVQAAEVRPTDHVVEVGAGIGTVARALPPCAGLTLLELDSRFSDILHTDVPNA